MSGRAITQSLSRTGARARGKYLRRGAANQQIPEGPDADWCLFGYAERSNHVRQSRTAREPRAARAADCVPPRRHPRAGQARLGLDAELESAILEGATLCNIPSIVACNPRCELSASASCRIGQNSTANRLQIHPQMNNETPSLVKLFCLGEYR